MVISADGEVCSSVLTCRFGIPLDLVSQSVALSWNFFSGSGKEPSDVRCKRGSGSP